MTDLFIVEAPGKIKKTQAILGNGFKVVASAGHIRDLPVKELGINLETFKPKYVTCRGKEKTVSYIKSLAKKANNIFIATDLDREGEAIAWHINQIIGRSDAKRVKYQEINKKAILEAIVNATDIDTNLFYAQEARRLLDRLVGYPVTSAIRQKHGQGSKLTAGRVQSIGVLLVIEREHEIEAFSPTEHYGARLTLQNNLNIEWDTKAYIDANHLDGKYITQRELAIAASKTANVTLIEQTEDIATVKPPPPLITSTLQQYAYAELGLTAEESMRVAQKLYEEGYITYHRTDSLYLSEPAIEQIRDFASKHNLPIPEKPWSRNSSADAQEAHEAIRPTDPELGKLPKDANKAMQQIYSLVRRYAIASQLAAAKDNKQKLNFLSECGSYQFKASATIELEKGFRQFVIEHNDDADGEQDDITEISSPIPPMDTDSKYQVSESCVLDKVTKPPLRYKENTLIKKLEKLGVGRPSTFASIASTLRSRPYVAVRNKELYPTQEAIDLHNMLNGAFSFYHTDYTKNCEKELDQIAKGRFNQLDFLSSHQSKLSQEIKTLLERSFSFSAARSSPPPKERKCPQCQSDMKYIPEKKGRYKAFFACPDQDNCGHTEAEKAAPPAPQRQCSKCKKDMRYIPAKKGKYNAFFACPDKQGCGHTEKESTDNQVRKTRGFCPKCNDGTMTERQGASTFFGCSNFPKCKHTEPA